MAASNNLTSLHEHEEALRKQSLDEILSSSDLTAHWNVVAEAMNAIYVFSHDHPHGSDDELTLQYLGIRLFNAGGGFHQTSAIGILPKSVRSPAGYHRDIFPYRLSL